MKRSAGFTLLELLITIAIVGVIGSILAVSWKSFSDRQRIRQAVDRLSWAIRGVQSQAIQQRRTRTIVIREAGDAIEFGIDGVFETVPYFEGSILPSSTTEFIFGFKGYAEPEVFNNSSLAFPSLVLTDTHDRKMCVRLKTVLGAIDIAEDDECY